MLVPKIYRELMFVLSLRLSAFFVLMGFKCKHNRIPKDREFVKIRIAYSDCCSLVYHKVLCL